MTASKVPPAALLDWLTVEQLAIELDRPIRWVEEHMAAGDIPSIQIGRYRFFTPECRARLVEQQLASAAPPAENPVAESWGRPARGSRSA